MVFTPIFWDGFEDGTGKRWDTFDGVISTSSKYGSYSANVAGVKDCRISLDGSEAEIYISQWFTITSTSSYSNLLTVRDGSLNSIILIRASKLTPGLIEVYNVASASWYISTTTINIDTWYHMEVHIKLGVSGAIQVKIDNILIIDESPDLSSFASIDQLHYGYISTTYGFGAGYLDNVVVGTGGWPGNLQIWRGTVDADGTTNQWTPSTGTDNYACVDEIPVVSTDYVATNTVDQIDLYTSPDMGFGLNTIYGVAVVTNNQTEGAPTPANASHVIRTGGTNYLGASQVVPGDASLMTIWATNPGTSAAWTQEEVQESEIGIKSLA